MLCRCIACKNGIWLHSFILIGITSAMVYAWMLSAHKKIASLGAGAVPGGRRGRGVGASTIKALPPCLPACLPAQVSSGPQHGCIKG
jgi:hypothetical protein